jgi:hypothetical protein
MNRILLSLEKKSRPKESTLKRLYLLYSCRNLQPHSSSSWVSQQKELRAGDWVDDSFQSSPGAEKCSTWIFSNWSVPARCHVKFVEMTSDLSRC